MFFPYQCNMTTNKERHSFNIIAITINFKSLHGTRENAYKISSDKWTMKQLIKSWRAPYRF